MLLLWISLEICVEDWNSGISRDTIPFSISHSFFFFFKLFLIEANIFFLAHLSHISSSYKKDGYLWVKLQMFGLIGVNSWFCTNLSLSL